MHYFRKGQILKVQPKNKRNNKTKQKIKENDQLALKSKKTEQERAKER